jgi:drug/metabolite transporter (DMT)-like permease
VILGLLAAVGASIGYGVATVLQALGTRRAGGLAAFRQPYVLAGFGLDIVSFLASLIAFERLPLFLVQAIIAASLVVVVLVAHPVLHTPLRRADLVAAGVVVAALVVLGGAAGTQPPKPADDAVVRVALIATAVLVVATIAFYPKGPAWVMGLASALGYSGVAIGVRGAREGGSLWHVLWQPMTLVVVASGVIAIVAYVRALERGPASLAASLVSVGEVVVPGVVGLVVLGDTIKAGWAVPAALAIAAALGGCLALARTPGAQVEAEAPTPD